MAKSKANIFQKYPLVWFFFLAYAFNFAISGIDLYIVDIPSPWDVWLSAFTPTFAAVLVAFGIGGRAELGRLFSGWTRWKVDWFWYLAAFSLVGLPALIGLVYILLGNPFDGPVQGSIGFWVWAVVTTVIQGPLGEETGWRGFALPRLQRRYNALVSSLILGLLWAFWHLPLYIFTGAARQTEYPLFIFVPMTVALAIWFTWIYNNTRGSILLTFLAHFSFNSAGGFVASRLGLMPYSMLFNVAGPFLAVLTLVVLFRAGPRHLSRKRVALPPLK
ncbi:MAG: type II CAAX endopeptidase family protein [Anaerolineales bacterium]